MRRNADLKAAMVDARTRAGNDRLGDRSGEATRHPAATLTVRGLALLVLFLATTLGHAAPGDTKASPGDPVELEWAGQRVRGRFVEYSATGWMKVEFDFNGLQMSPTLPPDQVRLLGGGKGAKGGTAKSNKRPLRTWTDKTGKFKTKARFIDLADDQLTLETDAGKTITMAIGKLSEDDQEVARKIAAKMAESAAAEADGGDENPFAGSPPAGPPAGGAMAAETVVGDGDFSDCRVVTAPAAGSWSVAVDAATIPEKTASKPIPLPPASKGAKPGFFETADGLLIARDTGKACVVIRDAAPGATATTRINLVDLVRGKVLGTVPWASALKPVDVDRSGEVLLARSDSMFTGVQAGPALGVWRFTDGGVEPVRVWNPQEPGNIHKTPPSFAALIDADHVVCVSFPGNLSTWRASEGKAIYRMEITSGSTPAVSPNGRHLAAAIDGGVALFDAHSGDPLGRLPGDVAEGGTLSFRPDGGQLAALSGQRLIVWDLASGEIYRDFAFSQAIAADSIEWLYGGAILAGGSALVDLERRIVLWRYMHDAGSGFSRGYREWGGRFWHVLSDAARTERAIYPAVLPHEEARKAAAGIDAEKVLAVRPGAALSIDMSRVQATPDEQQRVQQALQARLQAAGLTVAANAPLVLQAITETGKSQEISYRSFGGLDRSVEKVTTVEQISRLRILENGRSIWESVAVGGSPPFLQIKEGETIQQALAPYQKPNLTFFEMARLPSWVARQADGGAYGSSQLTPQGIKAAPAPAPAAGPPN